MRKVVIVGILIIIATILISSIITIIEKKKRERLNVFLLDVNLTAFPKGNIYIKVYGGEKYIDKKYTCDGVNVNPAIEIKTNDRRIVSFVIIVFDPDAPIGTFVHWVMYDIPSNIGKLDENIKKTSKVKYGYQLINDFGYIGYGGPCPPPGDKPHRYIFRVFGLDKFIGKEVYSLDELFKEMKDHIVAYEDYTLLYKRQAK